MPVNPKLALATVLTAAVIPMGALAAGTITRGDAQSSSGQGPVQLNIPTIPIGR
jgi:hypothetical protein